MAGFVVAHNMANTKNVGMGRLMYIKKQKTKKNHETEKLSLLLLQMKYFFLTLTCNFVSHSFLCSHSPFFCGCFEKYDFNLAKNEQGGKTFISRELVWEVLLSILIMLSVRNNRIAFVHWLEKRKKLLLFMLSGGGVCNGGSGDGGSISGLHSKCIIRLIYIWLMVSDTLFQLCCDVVVLCGRYLHGKDETKAS